MTTALTIIFATLLIVVTLSALVIKRLVYSLIMLFFSGLLLGAIFLIYGASYAGLFQIITFAGAVSVMFMVILMLVGGELLPTGPRFSREQLVGCILAAAGFLVVAIILWQSTGSLVRIDEGTVTQGLGTFGNDPLTFLWSFRSWDVLFLILLVSATLAGIVNLFSKEASED